MGQRINPSLIPRFNIDYGVHDFLFALKCAKKKQNFSVVESIFKGCYLNWTNSGRTSLYTILKSLNLPPNSGIGIPLYTCPSDFDAIINAGHVPVFLDIDSNNLTLSSDDLHNKIHKLGAVVVVHTFGRPADMDEIIRISGDKPVIEDCAHSLLSTYKGNLTGTIGTAAFFSFRSGKYISAGEGGMIITKNRDLMRNISREIGSYPTPSLQDELLHAFVTFFRSTMYHKPWFGLFSLPFGQLVEKKVDLMNKYSFSIANIRNTDLCVVLKKISTFHLKVEKNRVNSMYLVRMMDHLPIKIPREFSGTHSNYFLFPIICEDEFMRDKLSYMLSKKGVDTAKMFSTVPEIARAKYGYNGDCPISEFIADRILIIPNYYTLREKELNKIIRVMENEFI